MARKKFTAEMDMMERVAQDRVKRINTHYADIGNGKVMAMRPTDKGVGAGLAAQQALSIQKQQIFNKMISDGSTKVVNWGKNTQWAGRQLMVGFTMPLVAFGAVAGKVFMDLDKQARDFKRVYGDAMTAPAEIEKNLQAIKDLGAEYTKYGVKVSDTLNIGATAAAAGMKNDKLVAGTTETLRLATIGQIDYQQALTTTISLQNAFKLSNDELAPTVDFLGAVANQTVLTVDDMTKAIPRVAPVIKGLGGDVKDLAIMLVAMREGGVSAEQGANALKSGLASLINPTKGAIEATSKLGINLTGIVNANKGDLMGTVKAFGSALAGLSKFQRQQVLEKVFGKYQYARLGALFDNITKKSGQTQKAFDLTGKSAEELAAISKKSLDEVAGSTTAKFQGAIERLKLSIAPLGEAFLKVLTPIAEGLAKVAEWFNGLPDSVKNITVIATGIGAVVAPVLLMFVGLVANALGNIGKLVQGFRKFSAVLKGNASLFGFLKGEELDAAAATASLDGAMSGLTGEMAIQQGAIERLITLYAELASAAGAAAGRINGLSMAPAMMGGMVAGKGGKGGRAPRVGKFAGGVRAVPGSGNGDTVPALLTPGESVVTKSATQKYGPIIDAMNSGTIQGFATPPKASSGSTSRKVSVGGHEFDLHPNASFQAVETLLSQLVNVNQQVLGELRTIESDNRGLSKRALLNSGMFGPQLPHADRMVAAHTSGQIPMTDPRMIALMAKNPAIAEQLRISGGYGVSGSVIPMRDQANQRMKAVYDSQGKYVSGGLGFRDFTSEWNHSGRNKYIGAATQASKNVLRVSGAQEQLQVFEREVRKEAVRVAIANKRNVVVDEDVYAAQESVVKAFKEESAEIRRTTSADDKASRQVAGAKAAVARAMELSAGTIRSVRFLAPPGGVPSAKENLRTGVWTKSPTSDNILNRSGQYIGRGAWEGGVLKKVRGPSHVSVSGGYLSARKLLELGGQAQTSVSAMDRSAKSRLGVASPSKVGSMLGSNYIDGVIVGVKKQTPELAASGAAAAKALSNATRAALAKDMPMAAPFPNAGEKIVSQMKDYKPTVRGGLGLAGRGVADALRQIPRMAYVMAQGTAPIWTATGKILREIAGPMIAPIKGGIEQFKLSISGIGQSLKSAASTARNSLAGMKNPFAGMGGKLKGVGNPFSGMGGLFSGLKGGGNPFAGKGNPFGGMGGNFSNLFNRGRGSEQLAIGGGSAAQARQFSMRENFNMKYGERLRVIKNDVGDFGRNLKSSFNNFKSLNFRGLVEDGLVKGAGAAGRAYRKIFTREDPRTVKGFATSASTALAAVRNVGKEQMNKWKMLGTYLQQGAGQVFNNVKSSLSNGIRNIGPQLKSTFATLGTQTRDALKNAFTKQNLANVKTTMNNAARTFYTGIKDAFTKQGKVAGVAAGGGTGAAGPNIFQRAGLGKAFIDAGNSIKGAASEGGKGILTSLRTTALGIEEAGRGTAIAVGKLASALGRAGIGVGAAAAGNVKNWLNTSKNIGGPTRKESMAGNMGKANMGLMSIAMVGSMVEGPMQDLAQKAMMASMGLMALEQLGPLLMTPAGAMVGALVASAAAVWFFKAKADEMAGNMQKMSDSLIASSSTVKAVGDFYGKKSLAERAAIDVTKGATGATNAQVEQAKGFIASDAGVRMREGLASAMAKFGNDTASKQFAANLGSMVLQGVMNPQQAKAVAVEMGNALGNQQFGIDVNGTLKELLGPNNDNLLKTPVKLAIEINKQNSNTVDKITGDLTSLGATLGEFQQVTTGDMWSMIVPGFGEINAINKMTLGVDGLWGSIARSARGLLNTDNFEQVNADLQLMGGLMGNSVAQGYANVNSAQERYNTLVKAAADISDKDVKKKKQANALVKDQKELLDRLNKSMKKQQEEMTNTFNNAPSAAKVPILEGMRTSLAKQFENDPALKLAYDMISGDIQAAPQDIQFNINVGLESGILNPAVVQGFFNQFTNKQDAAATLNMLITTQGMGAAEEQILKILNMKNDALRKTAILNLQVVTNEAQGKAAPLGPDGKPVDIFKGTPLETTDLATNNKNAAAARARVTAAKIAYDDYVRQHALDAAQGTAAGGAVKHAQEGLAAAKNNVGTAYGTGVIAGKTRGLSGEKLSEYARSTDQYKAAYEDMLKAQKALDDALSSSAIKDQEFLTKKKQLQDDINKSQETYNKLLSSKTLTSKQKNALEKTYGTKAERAKLINDLLIAQDAIQGKGGTLSVSTDGKTKTELNDLIVKLGFIQKLPAKILKKIDVDSLVANASIESFKANWDKLKTDAQVAKYIGLNTKQFHNALNAAGTSWAEFSKLPNQQKTLVLSYITAIQTFEKKYSDAQQLMADHAALGSAAQTGVYGPGGKSATWSLGKVGGEGAGLQNGLDTALNPDNWTPSTPDTPNTPNTPNGTGGGNSGGGGGGTTPLQDLQNSLLAGIKMWADIGAKAKEVLTKKYSFLKLIQMHNGIDDKIRAAGFNPLMTEYLMGLDPDAANKLLAKFTDKRGRRTKEGTQAQEIMAYNAAQATIDANQTSIRGARYQRSAMGILQSQKKLGYKAASGLTNLIAGDPSLSQQFLALINKRNDALKAYNKAKAKADDNSKNKAIVRAANEAEKAWKAAKQQVKDFTSSLVQAQRTAGANELELSRISQAQNADRAQGLLDIANEKGISVSQELQDAIKSDPNYANEYGVRREALVAAREARKDAQADIIKAQGMKPGKKRDKAFKEAGLAYARAEAAIKKANTRLDAFWKQYEDFVAGVGLTPAELAQKQFDALSEKMDKGFAAETAKTTAALQERFQKANGMTTAEMQLQIDKNDRLIAQYQRELDLKQQAVEAEQHLNDLDQQRIDDMKRVDDMRLRTSDALSHDLEQMSLKEKEIQDAYNKKIEQLDKVLSINQQIVQAQQDQMGIAQALSQGDIYAATAAAQQMRANYAANASEMTKSALQKGMENQIAGLTTSGGLTREQAEAEIARIKEQSYQTSLLVRDIEDDIYDRNIGIRNATNAIYDYNVANLKPLQDANDKMTYTLGIYEKDLAIAIATEKFAGMTQAEWEKTKIAAEGYIGALVNGEDALVSAAATWAKIEASAKAALAAAEALANVTSARTPVGSSSGGARGFATGGIVGTDTVPAMLTPGEFVMTRAAVKRYGVSTLAAMNAGNFSMPTYSFAGRNDSVKAGRQNVANINAPVYNSVQVHVPNSNASPDDIANKVIYKMQQLDRSRIRGTNGR
jgi:TP901 family phage tail tape measure protein